jgi:Na+-transporting NADH:ubiquinone oxidoreductase subunit C
MRNSNLYTFGFAFVVCVVCAVLLGGSVSGLRDLQEINVRVDIQKNILKAVGLPESGNLDKMKNPEIEALYKSRIREDKTKKGQPVYLKLGSDASSVDAYCIPISGKGLWSTIYGYLALKSDLNSVLGITFYKHGETPGLGGEIEKDWFTDNFKKDKKILDENGKLVSINIVKGKANPTDPHAVDGISGATFTSIGVAKFIKSTLQDYESYFKKQRQQLAAAGPEQTPEGQEAAP